MTLKSHSKPKVSVMFLHEGMHPDWTFCVAISVVADNWHSKIIKAQLTMDEILECVDNPGHLSKLRSQD